MFHVTNTSANINLSDVKLVNEDNNNVLISVCDDGWNGDKNIATLNTSSQILSGVVLVGNNSSLTFNLTNGSSFDGYIDGKIVNASDETVSNEVGDVSITLDDSSKWTLTNDSYVSEFNGSAKNIIINGYKLYVNGIEYDETK